MSTNSSEKTVGSAGKEELKKKEEEQPQQLQQPQQKNNTTTKKKTKTKTHAKTIATTAKLKETPVEQLQKVTTEDEHMIAYLQQEFGERLNKISPNIVIRFVRGYAHEKNRTTETVKRLRQCLEHFDKYRFNTILDEPWSAEQECLEAWPAFIYGIDRQGHPVLYDEICCSDPSYVESVFCGDLNKINKFRLRLIQRLELRKEHLSKKYSVMIYKHVVVMDVSGASMSSLNKFRNAIQTIIAQEQHIFPETLHKLYIIKASWTFQMLWKIVSTFVDPLTYKKVEVLGQNYLPEILKIADKDQIPEKYGGTGKRPIVYGRDSEEEQSLKESVKNEPQSLTEPKRQTQKEKEKERI